MDMYQKKEQRKNNREQKIDNVELTKKTNINWLITINLTPVLIP